MEREAIELLEKEGIAHEDMILIRHLEMRYGGQWRSLAITVDKPLQSLEHAVEKFHEEHERAYAFSDPNKDVEIYGLRIEAIGVVPKPQFSKAEKRRSEERRVGKGGRSGWAERA